MGTMIRDLAPVEVAEAMSVLLDLLHDLTLRTEEHLLEHVEDIDRSHDHAEGRDGREPGIIDGK